MEDDKRTGIEHAMVAKMSSARIGRLQSLVERRQEQLDAARQELNEAYRNTQLVGFEVTSPVLVVAVDIDEDPCLACVINDENLSPEDCHGCIDEENRKAYLAGKTPLLDPIE